MKFTASGGFDITIPTDRTYYFYYIMFNSTGVETTNITLTLTNDVTGVQQTYTFMVRKLSLMLIM